MQRGLVGEIISRFEKKGFQMRALKMYNTPKQVCAYVPSRTLLGVCLLGTHSWLSCTSARVHTRW